MPEFLRSVIVILVIATTVFVVAKKNTLLKINDEAVLNRRIFSWYLITLAAFLAGNFWLFAAIAMTTLYVNGKRDPNPVAFAFFTLFAVPLFPNAIPGFGIVNYFFDLNYFRIIALTVFLPMYLKHLKSKSDVRFLSVGVDKFIASFIIYSLILMVIRGSFTNVLRQALLFFLDVFLPYYVISRHLKKEADFVDAIQSFVIAACIVALIGTFEYIKGWLMYQAVAGGLGISWDGGGYLLRDGSVRALASAGQAIVLGYIVAVAIGFNAYLCQQADSLKDKMIVSVVLLAGIVAPLSRGPWVQAALTCIIIVALSPKSLSKLVKIAALGILLITLLQFTPYGEKILSYVPFVGSVDSGNVEFRKNLLENAIVVLKENLWFGSSDFMQSEELEVMRSGGEGGIIDIVNSYIAIALSGGLVGLFIFVGYFFAVGKVLLDAYISAKNCAESLRQLIKMMIAVLLGVMIVIYTVSSIYFIPIIYWAMGGMAVALRATVYARNPMKYVA